MNISPPDSSLEPRLSVPSFSKAVALPNDVLSATTSVHPACGPLLPSDFEPSNYDVLCGRGKACAAWIGNRRFRITIAMNKERYKQAPTKLDKSLVVDEIVKTFSSASPNGGFIKKDASTGRWYKISEQQARDKVGHAMRDAVQSDDKKSNRQRKKRRSLYKQLSKTAPVPMTTSSSANIVTMESTSNSEVAHPVMASNDVRESFRSSFRDPAFATFILEALGRGPHEDEISLLSESALFHSLMTEGQAQA